MNTEDRLRQDAQHLWHNSFLRGLESGNDYVVKHSHGEEFPWSLINLRTRELWGHWQTREAMIKELSTAYMRPCNPC